MAAGLLSGCGLAAVGVGIGIPAGQVAVGVVGGSGGVRVGGSAGAVGVGVGVNQRVQVVGGAHFGAGVGALTVLHDPQWSEKTADVTDDAPAQPGDRQIQWRDSGGRIVSACRVHGGCSRSQRFRYSPVTWAPRSRTIVSLLAKTGDIK